MRLKNKAYKKSIGTIISGIVLLFLGIYFAAVSSLGKFQVQFLLPLGLIVGGIVYISTGVKRIIVLTKLTDNQTNVETISNYDSLSNAQFGHIDDYEKDMQDFKDQNPDKHAPTRFCPYCGKSVDEHFKFCNSCGAKIKDDD